MEPGSLFSPGRPALIVPLTGTNQVELRGQISRIPQVADLVEWRLDLLRDYHNPAYLPVNVCQPPRASSLPQRGTGRRLADGSHSPV